MHARFEVRKQELMAECEVSPAVFEGMKDRLHSFFEPFVESLGPQQQKTHAQTYVSGLASDLKRKNIESIAYRADQDRQGLQRFIGVVAWEHQPLLEALARQVGEELGEADGVLVFDPSGFAKKGTSSVGVQRQWLGRLGKVDNGQVGIYLGSVARAEHALVDVRLFLPEEWAKDRKRRKKCGVPQEVRFRTRHELALEMLQTNGPLLPHAWVAGDDEMGRSSGFRQELRTANERYLLAIPSNTTVRDLEGELPTWSGRGPKPKRRFEQVRDWSAALPATAWTQLSVRDGEKGPLVLELAKTRVLARTEGRRVGPEEVLVVTRTRDDEGVVKHDYYLSNAAWETPLSEFARVAKAEHRIEECLQRAKSEAGLADYEVRNWSGWHHHQTLSLIATWFLVKEARRGKKMESSAHGASGARGLGGVAPRGVWCLRSQPDRTRPHTPLRAKRPGAVLPLEKAKPLGSITR